jgi:RNA polymerase sigma-70 factor (ECF subfamily)
MTHLSLLDDLVEKAAARDRAAFEKLMLRFYPDLLRFIERRLPLDIRKVVDPEDVRQSTAAEAWQNLHTLRATQTIGFRAWLLATAQNVINNTRRHHHAIKRGGRRAAVTLAGGANSSQTAMSLLEYLARNSHSPRSIVANREYVELIRGAFDALDSIDRDALQGRYVQGLAHDQLAEKLGCTVAAARQRCLRALRQLRSLLPLSARDGSEM